MRKKKFLANDHPHKCYKTYLLTSLKQRQLSFKVKQIANNLKLKLGKGVI